MLSFKKIITGTSALFLAFTLNTAKAEIPAYDVTKNSDITSDSLNEYQQLKKLGEIYEQIQNMYVSDVDTKKIIDGAIEGMLKSLDPHSAYLNQDDFKKMNEHTQGEFGGLGIEIIGDPLGVKVITPIDDTPAQKAGIKANDLITEINGKEIANLPISEAIELMRGAPGEPITLTVIRDNESLTFDLKREIIKISAVKSKIINDIPYIRIASFTQRVAQDVEIEIQKIKKDHKNIPGIILDLRNNPGGLLDEANAVANLFLDEGIIVDVKGRGNIYQETSIAQKGDILNNLPIIVLVNGGSASASEIVAGALKDHKRGVIVGTKTFGKGSVQTLYPISDGSALKLTTALYYTPSGVSIQGTGIEPDIEIHSGKIERYDEREGGFESQLKGFILNPEGIELPKEIEVKEPSEQELLDHDVQLQYSINMLKGWTVLKSKGE